MSWVAELNANNQNTANEAWKYAGPGKVKATAARAPPIPICNETIQKRFVRNSSTSGDHSGLMTHGKYSQLV